MTASPTAHLDDAATAPDPARRPTLGAARDLATSPPGLVHRGAIVTGAAVALGVLGDALLRPTPWGLGAALWLVAATVATVCLATRGAVARRGTLGLAVPGVLAAVGLAWRDAPTLKALDVLAGLVVLALVAVRAPAETGGVAHRFRRPGVVDYALGAVAAGGHAAFGAVPLLAAGVGRSGQGGSPVAELTAWRHAGAASRGLVIAVPLLLVFGGLLVAADAVFAEVIARVFDRDIGTLASHALLTLVLAWLVAGHLRAAARDAAAPRLDVPVPDGLRLGAVEVGVVVGSLDALFLLFVGIQFRYLFAGADRVEASTTLTYAEYARRGFFELVVVAALALPLLLAVGWLLRPSRGVEESRSREERRSFTPPRLPRAVVVFRLLAGAQVALLGIVLASALQRMRLYTREYGLTELRLYTTAFMAWLAVVLLWFALTVVRDRRDRFAAGALLAAGLIVVALHVLNPDAVIVRTNAALAGESGGRPFDVSYVGSLSADAVPALVAALPDLPTSERCSLAGTLRSRWGANEEDWRTWSWGREVARRAVPEQESVLEACR